MAKTTKRKRVASVYATLAEVDGAMAEMIEARAARARLEARMNEQLTAVRRRFEPDIEEQTRAVDSREAQIKLFCDDNRAEVFGKRQSVTLTHGTLNYRLGTPKTVTLRKWTWKTALETLREAGGKFRKYVSSKFSVNKTAILADVAAGKLSAEEAASFGVEVKQEETFAVEPLYEEAEEARDAAEEATPLNSVKRGAA